jgi:hypothetical protein
MKDYNKLLCLLLFIPFLLLGCNKDDDTKQDDPLPAKKEFSFIEITLSDYYNLDITPISIDFNDDKIYIADEDMDISIFDEDYTYLGLVETEGGANIYAHTIRHRHQNGFFIYNQEYNYMMRYDEDCHRVCEINNLPDLDNDFICAIDVDNLDNVFMIYDHNTIHKYDYDFNGPLASATNIGDLFEHGNYPFEIMSICVDNNQNVYIAIDVDDENGEGYDAVLQFDNQLNFMRHLGGDSTFNGPCGIAFDNANNMYVVNRWQCTVRVFNTAFEQVAISGPLNSPGAQHGRLDEPIGIRINNNRVYITERKNHRVSVFSAYN